MQEEQERRSDVFETRPKVAQSLIGAGLVERQDDGRANTLLPSRRRRLWLRNYIAEGLALVEAQVVGAAVDLRLAGCLEDALKADALRRTEPKRSAGERENCRYSVEESQDREQLLAYLVANEARSGRVLGRPANVADSKAVELAEAELIVLEAEALWRCNHD